MGTQKKILIVEDDEVLRRSVAETLERSGYSVTQAENGDVGQYLSLLSNYDLLISDINMPEVDGIEMTKFIKSKLSIPVILITGMPQDLIAENIREAKVEMLLTKPFKREDLLNAVKKILH